jgi:hypothetical protein
VPDAGCHPVGVLKDDKFDALDGLGADHTGPDPAPHVRQGQAAQIGSDLRRDEGAGSALGTSG